MDHYIMRFNITSTLKPSNRLYGVLQVALLMRSGVTHLSLRGSVYLGVYLTTCIPLCPLFGGGAGMTCSLPFDPPDLTLCGDTELMTMIVTINSPTCHITGITKCNENFYSMEKWILWSFCPIFQWW